MERVIAYASRALTKEERKYATTKKELLAMVAFTKFFKHYLLGKEFTLRTDHGSLRWLHNFQGLEGQLARWVEQLASFQYKIVHRPGKQHSNADALSRLPGCLGETEVEPPPLAVETSAPIPVSAVREKQAPPVEQKRGQAPLVEQKSEQAPPVEQGSRQVPSVGSEGVECTDELARAQRDDPEISQLIRLKQGTSAQQDSPPEESELRKYAHVWRQLRMEGQRLVRVPPPRSDATLISQVVLPKAMVPDVLKTLHNTITGGHLGIHKLQAKVKDRFYWPSWFADVREYCRQCIDCASRKTQGKHPCAPLIPSKTSRPHQRIALDILGPLPETSDKNKYIVVIGDYFSKWTEAFPLPNQEAQTVAKVLAEQWVCRLGTPRSIHSDQGRNFESNLFRELCRLLDIHKTRTSPYHPQSDGMVERFNRTLLSMLSLFVDANQLNWDALLPYVMMAYRSSVHASTGFTPYKVLFGQEITLPVDVMLGVGQQDQFTSVNDYVTNLADTLSTVVEAVKRHQEEASSQQKAAFDFRANFQYYSEGELVWVQNKARKRGLCPKLQRRYKGPFKILEQVSDVLYRLVPAEGGPETVLHFNRLKPFVVGSFTGNPVPSGGPTGRARGPGTVSSAQAQLSPDGSGRCPVARPRDPTGWRSSGPSLANPHPLDWGRSSGLLAARPHLSDGGRSSGPSVARPHPLDGGRSSGPSVARPHPLDGGRSGGPSAARPHLSDGGRSSGPSEPLAGGQDQAPPMPPAASLDQPLAIAAPVGGPALATSPGTVPPQSERASLTSPGASEPHNGASQDTGVPAPLAVQGRHTSRYRKPPAWSKDYDMSGT